MPSPEIRTEQSADPEFLTDRSHLYTKLSGYLEKARKLNDASVNNLIHRLDTVLRDLQLLDTRRAVTEALTPIQEEVSTILRTADPLGQLFKFAADTHLEQWEKVY